MLDSLGTPIADRMAERLAKLLGPHTARTAVKTFTLKALGRGPETLTAADLPLLLAGLRPMLNTLIGREKSELVRAQLLRELGR